MIKHNITHYYQPTNNSCSQSALAILLSFFGQNLTPEEIVAKIPVNKNDKGEDWGTINQHLATWCLSLGFEVEMHTADFQIIDLSWIGLPEEKLLLRMELAKDSREVPILGKDWSKIYTQSYIDFVKAGGKLHIQPYMTTELLNSLIVESPILLCVNYNVLYSVGRSNNVGLRKAELDDVNGNLTNHSIVIYGIDDDGNYLVADPYKEPGLQVVEPERMIAGMSASQVECDNLFFQLKIK
jgi:hypothetical protein